MSPAVEVQSSLIVRSWTHSPTTRHPIPISGTCGAWPSVRSPSPLCPRAGPACPRYAHSLHLVQLRHEIQQLLFFIYIPGILPLSLGDEFFP